MLLLLFQCRWGAEVWQRITCVLVTVGKVPGLPWKFSLILIMLHSISLTSSFTNTCILSYSRRPPALPHLFSSLLFSFLHHLIPFLLPISFPPLLSLIKLPGALIKCNPPPPSPSSSGIRQSTNSISSPGSFEVDCQGNRQLLQFHHLHNPTTALIHAHQSGGWANMLDRAAHWH